MTISLYDILLPLRKWWWLLVAAALLAGGVSFLVTFRQPLLYQSQAILMIGQGIDNPNPTSSQLYLEQQLATAYANLANRSPVRKAVMEALDMTWLPQYRVAALPNSQMLEVVVVDTVPERAQRVAEEIAQQLISRSPSGENSVDQERQGFIQDQLDILQNQITSTQEELAELQSALGDLDSARDIQETRNQIAAVETKLRSLQTNYAGLFSATNQASVNRLQVFEPPSVPTTPIGPNNIFTAAMASAVGLSFAAAGIYAIHFLDRSVKTTTEVLNMIGVPVLGSIPNIEEGNVLDFVSRQPRSPISDAFRSLRTNLEFISAKRPLRKILVSGPMSGDGKTTIASNLAQIISQTGKNVLLLDGDLRNSTIHADLDLVDKPGLSTLLINAADTPEVSIPLGDTLSVNLIPSGPLPPNPTELVGSPKMADVLERLTSSVDLVVVDGPPFIVADAAILAEKMDGIIIVIRLGGSHRDAIKAMMEQVKMLNTPILGVVFNRHEEKPSYYSSYYHHTERKPVKRSFFSK